MPLVAFGPFYGNEVRFANYTGVGERLGFPVQLAGFYSSYWATLDNNNKAFASL